MNISRHRHKWTESELNDLWKSYKNGKKRKELAETYDVSLNSIHKQLKKLRKMHYAYDQNSFAKQWNVEKHNFHKNILEKIRPRNVLEGYAGYGGYTKEYLLYAENVTAIEISEDRIATLKKHENVEIKHGDVNVILPTLIAESRKYDFIDLDSYGSCWKSLIYSLECIDLGYIVFTFGEITSLGFRRFDSIFKRYPIQIKDIGKSQIENLIKQLIGYLVYEGLRRDIIIKPLAIIGHGIQPRRIYLSVKRDKYSSVKNHFEENVQYPSEGLFFWKGQDDFIHNIKFS